MFSPPLYVFFFQVKGFNLFLENLLYKLEVCGLSDI